jgi:TPR repeat protein
VPGDHLQAAEWWRMAAEQGHREAQFRIGAMYHEGKGVPEDYQQAVAWLREAAEHGHAGAQAGLGAMYVLGQGVPEDPVLAYMWLKLAADQGHEEARHARDKTAAAITAEQIVEGNRLAREWKQKQ